MAAASVRSSVLLLLVLLLTSTRAHALTRKEGRPGELNDQDTQEQFIEDIENYMTVAIPSDEYFGPGAVSSLFTDLGGGIRLHARLYIHDTATCLGSGRVGTVTGYELVEVFFNNMLSVVTDQIRRGFGFGVVVEGAHDPNLVREGLSAQFYYWMERIGQADEGASTPNTGEAAGPSDNDPNRHEELSLNVTRGDRFGSFNKTNTSTYFTNTSTSFTNTSTYFRNNINNSTLRRVQPPPKISNMTNSRSKKNIRSDDYLSDCSPYYYALFTSNYDINVLGSGSAYGDFGFPDLIYSPSQDYFMIMQDDCNLVLYYLPRSTNRRKATWACGDACYLKGTACFARINLDGTFAVYDGTGTALWWTPTQCSSGPGCWSDTYLTVQNDGNTVLYLMDTNEALWATNTNV